jgi:Domain of unknown function (DUF4384)
VNETLIRTRTRAFKTVFDKSTQAGVPSRGEFMESMGNVVIHLVGLSLAAIMAMAQSGNPSRVAAEPLAMEVSVLMWTANGKLTPVDPEREFRRGDRVKVELKANFSGYLYIINHGSSGQKQLLFPRAGASNRIESGALARFPAKSDLRFDETAGFETMQVIVSPERIALLDAAANQPGTPLDPEQIKAIGRYWQDAAPDDAGISQGEQDGSRDPDFDKKKRRITFKQRPRAAGASGFQGPPVSFGIKLKNIGAGR